MVRALKVYVTQITCVRGVALNRTSYGQTVARITNCARRNVVRASLERHRFVLKVRVML